VALDREQEARLILEVTNFDKFGMEFSAEVTGPIRGSEWTMVDGGETRQISMRLRAGRDPVSPPNGSVPGEPALLRGEIELRGHKQRLTTPIYFVRVPPGGAVAYTYDLDRDGANEWLIEGENLRAIAAPVSGGTLLGLVDKTLGDNLLSGAGAFVDALLGRPAALPAEAGDSTAKRHSLAIRPYAAEWRESQEGRAIQLQYAPPEPHAAQRIEKTIRFKGDSAVQASYRVLPEVAAAAPEATSNAEVDLASSVTLPAVDSPGGSTQICWNEPPSGQNEAREKREHCEEFRAGGGPVEIPEGVARLEVRTAGRPGVALEWQGASVRTESLSRSIVARFRAPFAPAPGGAAVMVVTIAALPVP
jgi:hypothetical protein